MMQHEWKGILLLLVLWPLLCVPDLAWGGATTTLTEAQYQTLKTQITVTDAAENQADITAGRDQVIADRYNQPVTPTFQVYRTAVSRRTLLFEKSPANTSFIFEGNGYLTLTSQELMTFHDFFDGPGLVMDPSLPNVQTGLDAIFKLPGNATSNRNHIKQQSARAVTRAEKLYVTGTNAGTIADPGFLQWEGLLTHNDIRYALRGGPRP
jgi:hypothetical protein